MHEVRGVLVEHPHSGGNAFGEENSLSAETESQSQHESASAAKTPKKKWVEPVTALLMALATVGTAWSSYQSAAFTRRSNRLMNEFNSLERRANLLNIQGMQAASIHAAMFMQLLAAQQAGNEKLADFYAQRFPPDVAESVPMPGSRKGLLRIQMLTRIHSSRTSMKFGARARPRRRMLKPLRK